jgi:hypothetical protein
MELKRECASFAGETKKKVPPAPFPSHRFPRTPYLPPPDCRISAFVYPTPTCVGKFEAQILITSYKTI